MLKNPIGTGIRNASIRNALTVVEVLFALGIILVGLVGIAAMIPFAARQASESYSITQKPCKKAKVQLGWLVPLIYRNRLRFVLGKSLRT